MTEAKSPVVAEELSIRTLDWPSLPVGTEFDGFYVGETEFPFTDKKTGEEKILVNTHWVEPDGMRASFIRDKGMQRSLEDAFAAPGSFLRLVKKEKADIGGGRTMNTYGVFSLQTNGYEALVKKAKDVGALLIDRRNTSIRPSAAHGSSSYEDQPSA